ncbi:MAG: alpha/beta hydrolase, partial [Chitinophagaceae bacterium]
MRFFFLLFLALPGLAQDTFYFKKALSVNAPLRYGREALYMDELAYRLYTGKLETPDEGKTFLSTDNAETVIWKALEADSLRRLRPAGSGFGARGRGPTYLYLTYHADKARSAIINIKGNAGFFLNGEPHMGDAYSSGWMYVPIKLKKGLNEFYVRGSFISASMFFPGKPVMLNTEDATVPSILPGKANSNLLAAIVVINSSEKKITGASIISSLNGKEKRTIIPDIPAMSMRKVLFALDASAVEAPGKPV